ncbi:uncharacterized protein LOC128877597 [Hylaeus volcanicus]|uniref:uncharacterized protein LOC128877597 n=1 Tax=Hylaeus volcanicus TaxID=313075 RepID=UPI0023B7BC46|nr:uncharacterized protein LOC128877597 [Hylaeus volcanicus]XP_053981011.1 uncharacterized protein LOC128877597 [Hylaeus volcanicus]XP_053981012.1 uncharacterized protein LOC128877597 [Hylaeus volcanicus]XP_053981013.1 uncharacterized protein LOC128877597 [Hylaeus volcanicus]
MPDQIQEGKEAIVDAVITEMVTEVEQQEDKKSLSEVDLEKKSRPRKYLTKRMKLYPELYRSDVSIHPSYTGLTNLPYYVICRRRLQRIKKQIRRQLNREVMHFAMMQMFAIDSVKVDRVFSVGMPQKTLIVPDLLTANERRHLNELFTNH